MSLDLQSFPEYSAKLKPNTLVYFAGPAERSIIKIGFTKWPRCRIRDLASWSPVPLELFAVAPGNLKTERKLHWHFVGCHSHREWFRATPELLDLIARVEVAGVLPDEIQNIVVPSRFVLPGQKVRGGNFIPTEKRRAVALRSAKLFGAPRPKGFQVSEESRRRMSESAVRGWAKRRARQAGEVSP